LHAEDNIVFDACHCTKRAEFWCDAVLSLLMRESMEESVEKLEEQ
jgi:hypothetical protein